ncbi:MAG: homoserine O-acetyltransferase, partial [Gammaproteobacteria bacterium]|nr:homoserine O-acetyltransferase [Gammaproteobacteria bacterium]
MAIDSTKFVKSKNIIIKNPLELLSGKILNEYQLTYETYGSLNADKS